MVSVRELTAAQQQLVKDMAANFGPKKTPAQPKTPAKRKTRKTPAQPKTPAKSKTSAQRKTPAKTKTPVQTKTPAQTNKKVPKTIIRRNLDGTFSHNENLGK